MKEYNTENMIEGIGHKKRKRATIAIIIMAIVLVVLYLLSMIAGKYPLDLKTIFTILRSVVFKVPGDYVHAAEIALVHVRIPRLTACVLVGMALSVSGATYQGIFRNPMVSPDLLGASAGAAFGACLAILMGVSYATLTMISFAFGLGAVALTWAVSSVVSRGSNSVMTLVLTGMVVAALFNAGVSITKTLADDGSDKLGEITFWLMGSMTHVKLETLPVLLIPVVVGVIPLMLISYRLNLMTFGDEEATALGVNVRALRIMAVLCATLVTAASVATCGMVGWIGLVIPHLVRFIVGPDYRVLLPASAITGGIFLMAVDNISRVFCNVEISIGILTAIIGAPFFLIMLMKQRGAWL